MNDPATVLTGAELGALTTPWRAQRRTIALVPTMGNLHAGHLSLCEAARRHADRVIVTIFVNPTQFGPGEDYESYPRTLDDDVAALRAAGCADAVFAPAIGEIYPHGTDAAIRLSMPPLSRELCGASRPGHFAGVAGVVLRLVNLTRPDVLVMGEQDFQQLVLVRWLLADLRLPVEVLGIPICRAEDGLALSSRNRYLSADERSRAPLLHRELAAAAAAIRAGAHEFERLEIDAARALGDAGFRVDYVTVRDADDLHAPQAPVPTGGLIVLGAATLGSARLIDNVRV